MKGFQSRNFTTTPPNYRSCVKLMLSLSYPIQTLNGLVISCSLPSRTSSIWWLNNSFVIFLLFANGFACWHRYSVICQGLNWNINDPLCQHKTPQYGSSTHPVLGPIVVEIKYYSSNFGDEIDKVFWKRDKVQQFFANAFSIALEIPPYFEFYDFSFNLLWQSAERQKGGIDGKGSDEKGLRILSSSSLLLLL